VESDPRGFLSRFGDAAVIDEVQHTPRLFSYLQGLSDERHRMGDFLLTGSQNFFCSPALPNHTKPLVLLPGRCLSHKAWTSPNPQRIDLGAQQVFRDLVAARSHTI
jgi:hypothetical protein